MTKFFIKYAIFFLLMIPAQAIIFNHAILFNVAVPLLFIWLIIMLPVTIGVNLSMTLGFLTGLVLDIFSDTPGVNALCCTVLAFVRKPVFHLYVSMDDDLASRSPSAQSMGHGAFMKFLSTMVLLYCTMVFTVEAFQFFSFRLLILRIIASSAYTFVLLYAFDSLFRRRRESYG